MLRSAVLYSLHELSVTWYKCHELSPYFLTISTECRLATDLFLSSANKKEKKEKQNVNHVNSAIVYMLLSR